MVEDKLSVEDKLRILEKINTDGPYWISRKDIDRLMKVAHAAIDLDRVFWANFYKVNGFTKLHEALEELGEC